MYIFSWNTTDIVAPHYGQPTLWNFKPFVTEWENTYTVQFKPQFDQISDSSDESEELDSIF